MAEQEWESEKNRVSTAHTAAVHAAQEHNERIKPAVATARVAAQELQRVVAFLSVVRACAARASLGVNYIPGSANLDRVVEMTTLTSALEAAYPELADPALQSPVAQCEVVPWEAWGTQPPRGVSADASFRKTRAALTRIQAIQSGYRVSAAESGAVSGRKRPVSARCRSNASPCPTHCMPSAEAVLGSAVDVSGGPASVEGMTGTAQSGEDTLAGCAGVAAPLTDAPGRMRKSQGVPAFLFSLDLSYEATGYGGVCAPASSHLHHVKNVQGLRIRHSQRSSLSDEVPLFCARRTPCLSTMQDGSGRSAHNLPPSNASLLC